MDWLHKHGYKITLNVHPADGVRAYEEAYPRVAEKMGIDPESKKAYFLICRSEIHGDVFEGTASSDGRRGSRLLVA